MTYEAHIVSREGHMTEQVVKRNRHGDVIAVEKDSELVTDLARAVAVELETGIAAEGEGATDEEAIEDANEQLEARILEMAHREDGSRDRAKEDPMARLIRLEAIVKEAGLGG